MLASDSAAVSQKMPGTPSAWPSTGPATIETMNDTPMVMPIIAIALVRCSSRVRSAVSAMMAAATAPEPCTTRPMSTPVMESDIAAITLPMANSSMPAAITGLRPTLSLSMPNGICNSACVRP